MTPTKGPPLSVKLMLLLQPPATMTTEPQAASVCFALSDSRSQTDIATHYIIHACSAALSEWPKSNRWTTISEQ